MSVLNKFFQSKSTTFAKARENSEISEEICVWDEENLLICGNGFFYYTKEDSLSEVLNKALRGGGKA